MTWRGFSRRGLAHSTGVVACAWIVLGAIAQKWRDSRVTIREFSPDAFCLDPTEAITAEMIDETTKFSLDVVPAFERSAGTLREDHR